MASPGASSYFPGLDRCLDGSAQLLSWQNVYLGLRDDICCEENQPVHSLLSDARAQDILKRLREPFPPPTAQSREAFNRMTSAINAPPSENGKYDIERIKTDALWLSQQANIDEEAALRLVLLEFQRSPTDRIAQEVRGADDIGLGRSFQQPALLRSVLGASQNIDLKRSILRVDHENDDSRKARLSAILLVERAYIAKVKQLVAFAFTASNEFKGPSWLPNVGAVLEDAWFENGNIHSFSAEILAASDAAVERVTQTCDWDLSEQYLPKIGDLWLSLAATELALHLQLMLHIIQSRTEMLPARFVRGWFELMLRTSFFESFDAINPDADGPHVHAIQSLASLISVAILQPTIAVAAIDDFAAEMTAPTTSNTQSYLRNTGCVDSITNALLEAAGQGGGPKLFLAGPSMYAWSVIMQTVRSYAAQFIEAREIRQAQKALDQPVDSDSDSIDPQQRLGERRRSSFGSDSDPSATLIEIISDTVARALPNGDPVEFFAQQSIGSTSGLHGFDTIARLSTEFCTAFGHDFQGQVGLEMRAVLLQLLSISLEWAPVLAELVQAILSVISGGLTSTELQAECKRFPRTHPISLFLNDERLMSKVLGTALARFPYETGTLFALAQCLACAPRELPDRPTSAILSALQRRETLTAFLIEGLADWDVLEDSRMQLASALDVFTAQDWQQAYESGLGHSALLEWFHGSRQKVTPFVIPAGTTGRALLAESVSANERKVVMWDFSYSALSYIGFKLQHDSRIWINDGNISAETLNDSVALITSFLHTSDDESAVQILGECSDNLLENDDIVQVVLHLCESLLYRQQAVDGVSALLVSCMSFIRATLRFFPGRIWPFLGRSGLLGLNKAENRLTVVVATSEVPSGMFPFLLECVQLFDDLVEDALTRGVERKSATKALSRFSTAEANTLSAGVTEGKMSSILAQFHALMTDIYESCRSWRYAFPSQRMTIIGRLSSVMSKSMQYAFDIDDTDDLLTKLFGFIVPSATYISDVFLGPSRNNPACHALIESALEGVDDPLDPLSTTDQCLVVKQTVAVLNLARRLVLFRHARDQKPAALEESLFKAVPHLMKIYSVHPFYRLPVVALLDSLVLTAGRMDSPPSLLAHVGTETVKDFLRVLFLLDEPFVDSKLSINIWRFLTSVVTQRQQWFSILLLTGSTPRESLEASRKQKEKERGKGNESEQGQEGETGTPPGASMLDLALEKASTLASVPAEEAEALLGFVAQAADYWPRVCFRINEKRESLDSLTAFIRRFDLADRGQMADSSRVPFRTQAVSHIMSLMTLLIHSEAEIGVTRFASSLVRNISHFITPEDLQHSAVANPRYNTSLQDRLAQNFSQRFANCSLLSLKRTLVPRTTLGKSFYYDLDIADQTLAYHRAWSGAGGSGFRAEMILANENLSLVEATVNMIHAWRSLVIEMAAVLPDDQTFQTDLDRIVLNCFEANRDSRLPETFFMRLAQTRVDLAFALLQRETSSPANPRMAQRILTTSWELLREASDDLGGALSGDDGQYYRTCLRALSRAVETVHNPQFQPERRSVLSDTPPNMISVDTTLLEILRLVVAKGFQSIVSVLHDDATKVQAGDLALLLAIMRMVFAAPGIEKHHTDITNIFSDAKTATYASTLFSWSNKILVDGDPVYGELSIGFLLELSNIQALAESIVASGCLAQIRASSLARVFYDGRGPFDPPVRVYSIWAKGILPLTLNILSALGPLIAADIAIFINTFIGQLSRVNNQFNMKNSKNPYSGLVTLAIAGEIHSLALISRILDLCRDAGASAGIVSASIQDIAWDRTRVMQDVEDLLSRRSDLRDSIVPTTAGEELMVADKKVGGFAEVTDAANVLEEKVVGLLSKALEILNAIDG